MCYWTRKAVNSALFVFLGSKSVHYSEIELNLSILHGHEMSGKLPERGKKEKKRNKQKQKRNSKELISN